MSGGAPKKPFARRAAFDQPELVGARWWAEGMRADATGVTRRKALGQIALATGGVVGLGVLIASWDRIFGGGGSSGGRGVSGARDLALQKTGFDETTFTQEALAAQRAQGWDVGSAGVALEYPGECAVDATGEAVSLAAATDFAAELSPVQPRLAPWYVSTLLQSIDQRANASLRAGLKPIF
jgi:hypothetical protein